MINYCIFVQARMSSSRSPGKVLTDIYGKPMLIRQLERLRQNNPEIPLLCLTSKDKKDDAIEEACKEFNFNFFRGSLNNVLERYIKAAEFHNVSNILRIGGDDPLVDTNACKILINEHKKTNADFLYTGHKNGWPLGCFTELISVKALLEIQDLTSDPLYLEHIIPWFYHNKDKYNIIPINAPKELNRPSYFFTVDFPEDIKLINMIFKKLSNYGDYFSFNEVIKLCDSNPEILEINKHLHEEMNF